MPSPGKKVQRGFVRNVGNTPSKADRSKKSVKTGEAEKVLPPGECAPPTLDVLKLQHPNLYTSAEKFARRHDANRARTEELMIQFINDALSTSERIAKEEAAIARVVQRQKQKLL